MTQRPTLGKGLFYTRDSAGHSELAPPQYVAWARTEAARLGVSFSGTPEAMMAMVARRASAEGDLYLDYGISGNLLRRPGFDAFRERALSDAGVSHLFIVRRDRIARPDNPLDAMSAEFDLRSAGLTLVLEGKVLPPFPRGRRIDLADLLTSMVDYDSAGRFRTDLSVKLIQAKVALARQGFSIGGDAVYGFRRWLIGPDGSRKRQLERGERVKMPGHHVAWLPTAEDELAVVRRIVDMIWTMPVGRVARVLNDEGVPSPMAGRSREAGGVAVPVSGAWTANTVKNVATHPLLAAVLHYGRRSEGDQRRFTPDGPRPLEAGDYAPDGRLRTVTNPAERVLVVPARCEPVVAPERLEAVRATLEERGRHLKGKARARGGAPNPLGGRIYDINCGWPMYRTARRGTWCYRCGLYQNSQAACCAHNFVPGPAVSRFVLAAIKQRVFRPDTLAKLKHRLERLAAGEAGPDPAAERAERDREALAGVQRKLQTVGRNMALAETPEERSATAAVFGELTAQASRLETSIRADAPQRPDQSPDREVEAALATLGRLTELAERPDAAASVSSLVAAVNAKLYLRFRRVQRGRRDFNKLSGGVLTFGTTDPPVPLYGGPTDRPVVRRMIQRGEAVTSVPGHGAPERSDIGAEVSGSANVQRGTQRCT